MIFDKLSALRRSDSAQPESGGGFHIFGNPTAGVQVNEDSALTYSAYYGCIRIIAETIAMLPWELMRADGDHRNKVTDHSLSQVISRRPNEEMTPMTFRETLIAHAVGRGNGYAEIELTRGGDVANLWPVESDRVNPDRDSRGRLWYDVSNASQANTVFRPREIIHVKGMGFDGTVGYSPARLAREGISMGLAAEKFGAGFFGNGAILSAVIEQKKAAAGGKGLSGPAIKNLKKTFNRRHQGAGNNSGIEVLDAGMEYKRIGIAPEEAQFLESRKYQVLEMCRWFRMPPHKLAELERSTHNNIESQNIEFAVDTLLPWAVRFEQEINLKLFKSTEANLYTRLNLGMLLRGDSKARGEFYKLMMSNGVYSIDEVRALEDKNPLPDGQGKLRMVPMNMVSVETANKQGTTAKQKQVGQGKKVNQGVQTVLSDVARRLTKIEVKRVQEAMKKPAAVDALSGFCALYKDRLVGDLIGVVQLLKGCDDKAARSIAEGFTATWVQTMEMDAKVAIDAEKTEALIARWESTRVEQFKEQFLLATKGGN